MPFVHAAQEVEAILGVQVSQSTVPTADGGSRQARVPSATGARYTAIQHEDHAACDGDVSRWSDGPHSRQPVARSQKPCDWQGETCTGDHLHTRSAQANKRPYRLLSARRRGINQARAVCAVQDGALW